MGVRRGILARVMVLLLLGAIVNVAVAWGCAFWSAASGVSPLLDGDDVSSVWHEWALPHWPEPPAFEGVIDVGSMGVTGGMASGVSAIDIEAGVETSVLWSYYGLPWRSMRCIIWIEDFLPVRESRLVMNGRSYPLRPIWPGFAFNTAFYAALIWMCIAVPAELRRKRRRSHGLCVKCAYDLRGREGRSDGCPECGASAKCAAPAGRWNVAPGGAAHLCHSRALGGRESRGRRAALRATTGTCVRVASLE